MKNQEQEILKIMTGIEIEKRIEDMADQRYYNSFKYGFYADEKTEMLDIKINENIYLEYVELAKKNGCELGEEFITLILLDYLDKQVPKKNIKEFALRDLKEEAGEKEYQFVIKYMKLGYDWKSLIGYAYETEDLTIEGFIKGENQE